MSTLKLDEQTRSLAKGIREVHTRAATRPPAKDKLDALRAALATLWDMDDETAAYVAAKVGVDRFGAFIGSVYELADALSGAPPSRRGRTSLDPWLEFVAKLLVSYYREHTGDTSGPYFKDDGQYTPGNDFTVWFVKTMQDLHPDVTPSQCQTLLKRHGQK
jgi:hypothetical protein